MVCEADVTFWIRSQLAELLARPVERIDAEMTFAQLGVDSASATNLLLALEEYLEIEVDPDTALGLPTIAALCSYAIELSQRRGTVG